MLTTDELNRIKAYCDAATEPWIKDDLGMAQKIGDFWHTVIMMVTADAEFVVNARIDLPRLHAAYCELDRLARGVCERASAWTDDRDELKELREFLVAEMG